MISYTRCVVPCCLCIVASVAESAQPCVPTPLSEPEAEDLVMLVPPELSIVNRGGKLSLVQNNMPAGLPHRGLFYTFMVLTDAHGTTLLDNGVVGYYTVNKVSGEVFDVADDEVVDPELTTLQKQLRTKHCVANGLVLKNRDIAPP